MRDPEGAAHPNEAVRSAVLAARGHGAGCQCGCLRELGLCPPPPTSAWPVPRFVSVTHPAPPGLHLVRELRVYAPEPGMHCSVKLEPAAGLQTEISLKNSFVYTIHKYDLFRIKGCFENLNIFKLNGQVFCYFT